MSREVTCVKLKKRAPGLPAKPLPGPVGERIFKEISVEAWQDWVKHQTMLINENRLIMTDPKARAFLMNEMEAYLFGEGSKKPDSYVPPSEKET